MDFIKSLASKKLAVAIGLIVLGALAILQVNITAIAITYIASQAFVDGLKIWKQK